MRFPSYDPDWAGKWHVWWAWHPVTVVLEDGQHQTVWLEYVYRRLDPVGWDHDWEYCWEYPYNRHLSGDGEIDSRAVGCIQAEGR